MGAASGIQYEAWALGTTGTLVRQMPFGRRRCGGRIGADLNPNLVGGASASGPVPGSLPPSWQWARVSGRRSLRAPSSCYGRSRTCPARPRTRARPPMRARVGRRHASRQHLGGGLGSGRGKAGRAPRAAEAKSRLFYDQKMSPSYHLPRFRSFPWLLYSGRFGPRLVITHKPISWYGIIDNDAQNDTGCHAACCHVE